MRCMLQTIWALVKTFLGSRASLAAERGGDEIGSSEPRSPKATLFVTTLCFYRVAPPLANKTCRSSRPVRHQNRKQPSSDSRDSG